MINQKLVNFVLNGLKGKWKQNFLIIEERYNNYEKNPFLYFQTDEKVLIRVSNKKDSNVVSIGYMQPNHDNYFLSVVTINCNFSKNRSLIVSDINARIIIHYNEALTLKNGKEGDLKKTLEEKKLNEYALNSIKKSINENSIFQNDNYKNYSIVHKKKRTKEIHIKLFGENVEVTKANIYQKNDNSYNVTLPDLTAQELIMLISLLKL